VIHHFQGDISFEGLQEFTDPFRYMPHPLVKVAAEKIIKKHTTEEKMTSFLNVKILYISPPHNNIMKIFLKKYKQMFAFLENMCYSSVISIEREESYCGKDFRYSKENLRIFS
jgi:hypothetical protein